MAKVYVTNHMSRANGFNMKRYDVDRKEAVGRFAWAAPGETVEFDADEWEAYLKVTPSAVALLDNGALSTGTKPRGMVTPTHHRSSYPVPPEHLADPLAAKGKHKVENKSRTEFVEATPEAEPDLLDDSAEGEQPTTTRRGKAGK